MKNKIIAILLLCCYILVLGHSMILHTGTTGNHHPFEELCLCPCHQHFQSLSKNGYEDGSRYPHHCCCFDYEKYIIANGSHSSIDKLAPIATIALPANFTQCNINPIRKAKCRYLRRNDFIINCFHPKTNGFRGPPVV